MKKVFSLLLLLSLALAAMVGCNKKEIASPSQQPGKVITTPAYEKYFGAAPTVDKGTAYAFVIFFPSTKEPGKVVPFPFFTFDESSLTKVATERLLGGMAEGSYRGDFAPFPVGTRLLALNLDKGTLTLNFSKELLEAGDKQLQLGMARTLALTLRQFKGISDVRVLVEGKENILSAQVKSTTVSDIQQPSAPRLLSVTAMRDKGAKDVEDVNAFFDRPVEVRELKLLSGDGQPLSGELFHSVFDMAAVLKPKDPTLFKAGQQIRVRWNVVDKLGRQAEGDEVRLLDVKEH